MSDGLHWRQIGTSLRQVVALHCSLAQGGAWKKLGARLPELVIIAPDLPGHGRSADWNGQGDYHDLATREVAALVAGVGQGAPVDLIGHSLGATLALRLALERPELVRSLALMEPVLFAAARAAEAPEFAAHLAAEAPFRAAFAAGDREAAARLFHAEWGQGSFDDLSPRHRAYIVGRIGLVVAQDAALTADSAGLLGYQRLEGLGVPVLLLEGSASPPVIGAIGRELARRLPMARRQVIAGASHMLPITHPETVAEAVSGFLSGV